MMKNSPIISGYVQEICGKPTIAKVLNDFFYKNENGASISESWAESTVRQYLNDLTRRLIPNCYNNIPLEDYTQETVLQIMRNIQKRYNFDEKTMSHYRWLFWKIYEAGLTNELYPNKLFWKELDIVGRHYANKSSKRRLLVQKRTLSISEEVKLLSYFEQLDPSSAPGEAYGLLLMYCMPMRNQEAAGLNFGDIRAFSHNDDASAIYLYKTTGTNTNRVKAGGKTRNMFRILPILKFAKRIIEARKEFLKEISVASDLMEKMEVDDLPIVCKGKNYKVRCNSGDISNFARDLFQKLGIGKAALDEATRLLYLKADVEEDNPTAYLLRRNALNHLYCLNFEMAEMEYCMGHFIAEGDTVRNDFTNEDLFLKMHEKLAKHPAEVIFSKYKVVESVSVDSLVSRFGSLKAFDLPVSAKDEAYEFELFANEAGDGFDIIFSEAVESNCNVGPYLGNYKQPNTIDLSDRIANEYVAAYEQLQEGECL